MPNEQPVSTSINQRLENVEDKLEQFNDNLELVLGALTGNKLTQDGGIVRDIQNTFKTIAEVDNRLKTLEAFKDRVYWTIFLLSTGATVVGAVLGIAIAFLSFKKQ